MGNDIKEALRKICNTYMTLREENVDFFPHLPIPLCPLGRVAGHHLAAVPGSPHERAGPGNAGRGSPPGRRRPSRWSLSRIKRTAKGGLVFHLEALRASWIQGLRAVGSGWGSYEGLFAVSTVYYLLWEGKRPPRNDLAITCRTARHRAQTCCRSQGPACRNSSSAPPRPPTHPFLLGQ